MTLVHGKVWKSLGIVAVILGGIPSAHALVPSFPLGDALSNLAGFLSPSVINSAVKTVGITFNHRSLEPATPLGTSIGFDVGIEANVVQVSTELADALAAQGTNITLPPFLPSLKELNIHKGIGNSIDVGASAFALDSYLLWGVDLKVVVYSPEEGPTWALRMSYASVHVPLGSTTIGSTTVNVELNTTTWTPQLLFSKKLEFADPYVGIGYHFVSGAANVSFNGASVPGIGTVAGSGSSFLSFIGLSLRAPNIGLRLTLEGTYSVAGFNSLGTKLGFSF